MNFGDPRISKRKWSKVQPTTDGCWVWTGSAQQGGYGVAALRGQNTTAHRIFYEQLIGPIRSETLDHLCRVRSCVNPAHLEPVSQRENVLRGTGLAAFRARQTSCQRGREFSGENLFIEGNGTRRCVACRNAGQRARYARRIAQCS